MKKLFALILALSVLCSFSVIAQAADNTVADDTAMLEENMILAREKATTFLNDFDSSLNVTLSDPVILYNAQQEPEAASFTINDTGYIIVNLKSLRVPEFSLKKSSPFISQDKKYIYNGPVSYYETISSTEVRSLNSGTIIETNDLAVRYNEMTADKAIKSNAERSALPEDRTDKNPSRWQTPHYCGVDGAAILLKYWDDNFNEAFIESGKETAETFVSYLIDEKYLLDEGLSGSDIVHGSGVIFKSSTGISDYIKDRGLSSGYAITDVSYSWSTITTQVTTNNAILLAGTDAETHPDYPNHWIIVYGYKTVSGERFLLINYGWGDDEIYTTADSQYYPWGLVYIYEK